MNRILWMALTTSLLAADAPRPDVPETDQDRIQGAWVMMGRESNGQADNPDSLNTQTMMVFEGDRVIARMGPMSAELGAFALDSTKSPRHYNRTYGDGTLRQGIYELEGETLKICLPAIGKGRPTSFATKPGDGTSLLIYKRASPTE